MFFANIQQGTLLKVLYKKSDKNFVKLKTFLEIVSLAMN